MFIGWLFVTFVTVRGRHRFFFPARYLFHSFVSNRVPLFSSWGLREWHPVLGPWSDTLSLACGVAFCPWHHVPVSWTHYFSSKPVFVISIPLISGLYSARHVTYYVTSGEWNLRKDLKQTKAEAARKKDFLRYKKKNWKRGSHLCCIWMWSSCLQPEDEINRGKKTEPGEL